MDNPTETEYRPPMPTETPIPVPEQWDYRDVAEFLGVTPGTVRKYHQTEFMPKADGRLGQSPWWHPATIREWDASRPGPPGARRDRTEVAP